LLYGIVAANDPVNKTDPTGKFADLGSMTVAMGMNSSLSSINLGGLPTEFHGYKREYKYDGVAITASGGAVVGGGIWRVVLTSECNKNRKYVGKYLLAMGGLTAGLPGGSTTFSFEIHAKQVYGPPDLKKMTGLALVISASFNNSTDLITGFSVGTLYMGAGVSEPIDFTGSFTGVDISADYFIGGSFMYAGPNEMVCN